jgi:hypothetical protein
MALKKNNRTKAAPTASPASRLHTLVTWLDAGGAQHTEGASPLLLHRDLHTATRARIGVQYKGKRNYQGIYFFASSRQHVWHESLFEMTALTWLDHQHDIVAIASQPMMLQFPDGRVHFPDYFALHEDGRQVLYDVRPAKLINEKTQAQFDETRRLCNAVGWDYELFTNISPIAKANLEWIAGYRAKRYRPPATAIAVLDLLDQPISFRDLQALISPGNRGRGSSAIYSLLWDRIITTDHNQHLNSASTFRRTNYVAH